MTLQEATERLQIMFDMREKRGYHSEQAALKLGIEALKGLQALRRGKGHSLAELLPGETKE